MTRRPGQLGGALSRTPRADLPAWPVYVLFVGFPLWWVLGFGAFAVLLTAVPMVVLMVQYRRVEMPPAFTLWLVFLAWTVVAATQLAPRQWLGFFVRFGNLAGCAVLFLYIFNARRTLPTRRVLAALVCFLALVVVGGYLGLAAPHGSITTVAEKLLPGSISSNEYVHALVQPPFAEYQQPYGSPVGFSRPSAPFPYTNSWGCNMSLLIPLAFAALSRVRSPRGRVLIIAVLVAGIVPALASLNRGLYVGLVIAVVYVATRLALRGRLVPLAGLLGLAAAVYAVALATGFVAQLQQRLVYSESNTGREAIYQESWGGAVKAPLWGNGAPRPSETVDVAVGSQGQIWNLMFSYGFVALGLFVAFFVVAWWASRPASGPGDLWISASLVVAVVSFIFYGYDGPQLAVVMTAAALAMRERFAVRAARAAFDAEGSTPPSAPRPGPVYAD